MPNAENPVTYFFRVPVKPGEKIPLPGTGEKMVNFLDRPWPGCSVVTFEGFGPAPEPDPTVFIRKPLEQKSVEELADAA